MKKFILAFVALFTIAISASAMSYEQAREQALFLTDKMAYELNLTDEQYEAAYEVNLDYLMNINHHSDLYGVYWQQRNLDLQYILLDWQYRSFLDALYFYRPLYWEAGFWHFRIYARYPHRDYFYFGRPHFYTVYRGGHSWRVNGGRSWYHGRVFVRNSGNRHFGMRDGFSRGDYGNRRNAIVFSVASVIQKLALITIVLVLIVEFLAEVVLLNVIIFLAIAAVLLNAVTTSLVVLVAVALAKP
jgi:hypothetical protein